MQLLSKYAAPFKISILAQNTSQWYKPNKTNNPELTSTCVLLKSSKIKSQSISKRTIVQTSPMRKVIKILSPLSAH